MNEVKEETKIEPQVAPTKTKGFRLSKWTMVIIIVAVVAIIASGILWLTRNKTTTGVTTKPDTADEIKIKQYLSSLRGDIVRFYDEKKTYEGWTPNVTAVEEVKKMGSELKTQALTKDTYIIYAKMPSSKTIFCMDANGFTAEVKSLMAWAKSCQ